MMSIWSDPYGARYPYTDTIAFRADLVLLRAAALVEDHLEAVEKVQAVVVQEMRQG